MIMTITVSDLLSTEIKILVAIYIAIYEQIKYVQVFQIMVIKAQTLAQ